MQLDKALKCLVIKDGFQEPVVSEGGDSHALPSAQFRSWLIVHVSGAI